LHWQTIESMSISSNGIIPCVQKIARLCKTNGARR
jgi:hypothetical protein